MLEKPETKFINNKISKRLSHKPFTIQYSKMAPRMAAVLRAPRKLCRFSYVLFVFLLFYVLDVVSITVYDRDTLLNIGSSIAQRVAPLHINIEFMSVCYVRMEIVLRLSSCIS